MASKPARWCAWPIWPMGMVDMGTPAGVPLAAASVGCGRPRPDVQFNRQWLRTLMAQQRFQQSATMPGGTLPSKAAAPGVAAR